MIRYKYASVRYDTTSSSSRVLHCTSTRLYFKCVCWQGAIRHIRMPIYINKLHDNTSCVFLFYSFYKDYVQYISRGLILIIFASVEAPRCTEHDETMMSRFPRDRNMHPFGLQIQSVEEF